MDAQVNVCKNWRGTQNQCTPEVMHKFSWHLKTKLPIHSSEPVGTYYYLGTNTFAVAIMIVVTHCDNLQVANYCIAGNFGEHKLGKMALIWQNVNLAI